MRGFRFFLCLLFFATLALPSLAQDVEVLVERSMQMARAGDYRAAEEVLAQALRVVPDAPDIRAAQARVDLWQGRYEKAQPVIDQLIESYPDNPDYLMLRAVSLTYQGQEGSARDAYERLLEKYPDHLEAQAGLDIIRKRLSTPLAKLWRADMGYGLSTFQFSNNRNWHHQYAQILRQIVPQKTSLGFRAERFTQYEKNATVFQGLLAHRISPLWGFDIEVGGSPEASYKPVFKVLASMDGRVFSAQQTYFPVWLRATVRQDWYKDVENRSYAFGPAFELADAWEVSAKGLYAHQMGGRSVSGWTTQLSGRLRPHLGLTVGYAMMPDIEESFAFEQETAFGSIVLDVTDSFGVRLDYVREDRNQSFTRNSLNVGFSYKF